VNSNTQFKILIAPGVAVIKTTAVEFLESLRCPVIIDIPGIDSSRTRVFTTLIHGNEPSGLIAVHQWLLELESARKRPHTNIRIIIPSVLAALNPPIFHARYLDGSKDLNRCFGSQQIDDQQYLLANQIEAAIREVNPETIIDIHNTSGSSPAFCVSVKAGVLEKNLAAFFCNQLIHTEIRLGAVMELDFDCPIVTIECGGCDDLVSVKRAHHGIKQMAEVDDLKIELENESVDVCRHPIRVQINPQFTLAYSDNELQNINLVLVADNERRNFGTTHKGTFLGWIKGTCRETLTALNPIGINVCEELFDVRQGKLYTAKDLNFFMATDRADIAVGDCLFYVTEVAL